MNTTSRAFSSEVKVVAELITSSTTFWTTVSFSPWANKNRYSAVKIVDRASTKAEFRFTSLTPADN